MKFQLKNFVILVMALFFAANPFKSSDLFASGHGCATHEPDRDGDGIPDKDDSFPDDPSRSNEENSQGNQERFCGTEPVQMKVYFVPFNTQTPSPITKDNIEKNRVNALWFCSKNDVTDTLQTILDPNSGAGGETAGAAGTAKAKAHYGLVTGPDSEGELADEDKSSAEAEGETAGKPVQEGAISGKDEEDLDKLFKEDTGSTTESIDKETAGDEESEFPLGSVDGNQIRLKVEVPKNTTQEIVYLVDKSGEGVKNGQPFKLSPKQMSAIEKMVQSVSGVVDLNLRPICQNDAVKPEATEPITTTI